MVGRSRVSGIDFAFARAAIACLVLGVGGCVVSSGRPEPLPDSVDAGGSGGASGEPRPPSFGPSAGGSVGIIGTAGAACIAPPGMGKAVFADQTVDDGEPARRELFSWLTDEQATSIRQDRVLFSQSAHTGVGLGYAFPVLTRIGEDPTVPERAQLANLLGGELFAKGRYAWSEPWASRMGWPGEDYGGNLLRVVLKAEAWIVVVKGGDLKVFDLQNEPVSLAEALSTPTRLGAIFYEKDEFAGGPSCNGRFSSGNNGYREFIVGNLAMVEEWSLGTQQNRDRLSANIDQLGSFLERSRSCPITSSAEQWNLAVVCHWGQASPPDAMELFAYEQALSIPSDNYLAVPERIAAIIDTLRGDLFELDPLVVAPGSP